jgi:hypothetical protein
MRAYKDRELKAGDRVLVYRNLTDDCLSIRQGNLVYGHTDYVVLENVKFKVRDSGQRMVRATGHKQVHAFVEGDFLVDTSLDNPEYMYKTLEESGFRRVYYNPHAVDTFVTYDDRKPIKESKSAIVVMDRVYIR